ncbi:MAG: hypothetical protein IJV16_07705 [Lachnospiraceae bacterium]|nr:hypothetical protein [Lachnospiraceae bacterium]MBR1523075.1 hypothetical protein [Lachnospiraceae bacterium]
MKRIKGIILIICGIMIIGIYGRLNTVSCLAADNNTTNQENNEDKYKLNDDVKEWLDAGGGIPSDVKYATLSSTNHLWELDSTDISDGKVELKGNNETREIYGLALCDWLKTQFFYGDNFGSDNNRKKFVRPKKAVAF